MQEQAGFRFGPFRLDVDDERLWRGSDVLPLRHKTFGVLHALVTRAGQLLTKDALLAAVWPETTVSETVLTGAIRELRRVLGDQARCPQFIETVHGRGYRFIAPVAVAEPSSERLPTVDLLPSSPPGAVARPAYFVGRTGELAQLQQWWAQARQGRRQVVCITGAAGIGKTALVDTFVARVRATQVVWVGHGQCLAQHGSGEPYLPVLEALGRLCQGAEGAHFLRFLRQYAPSWVVQMPALLSPADRAALPLAGGVPPPRMLRELTEALDRMTVERPLVLVLEDLQWSDGATLEWLTYVARRRDPARLLLLGTYRPVDAMVRAHPVRTVMTDLTQHQQAAELPLDALSEDDVTAYSGQRLRVHPVPAALAWALYQRSQGHPLFLVTIIDTLLRQGLLHEGVMSRDVSQAVAAIMGAVPENLRQIIEQQLSQVSPEDRDLLAVASIAGREFSAALVAAVGYQGTEDIEARLAVLAHNGQFVRSAGLVIWPDGTVAAGYSFLHDLYWETLAERVPPSRKRRWHLEIGTRKEAGYGMRAREMAAELAVHFVQGGDPVRAVQYLYDAGENALQRSAHQEAITHFTQGLVLLAQWPDTSKRAQQELGLLAALGPVLMAIKGYTAPEVVHAYARARELCQQVGETPQLCEILMGLCVFYQERGELQTALALAEQLLHLAQRLHDPMRLLWAHNTLGYTLFVMAEVVQARPHLEESLALYQRHMPHTTDFVFDPGVDDLCILAEILFVLGYPDQALTYNHEALTLARELSHPFSLALARQYAAIMHRRRGELQAAQALEEASMAVCREHAFTQGVAQVMIWQGWDLVQQGQAEVGIGHMRQGLEALQTTGAVADWLWLLPVVATAYGHVGRAEVGLALLTEAMDTIDTPGKRIEEAGLYRCKGDLLLKLDAMRHRRQVGDQSLAAEAEACLHRSLAIARHQQTRALELQAALSLGRLWQQQGKCAAAYQTLVEVYGWFTEGFDTADLQEARALLAELEPPARTLQSVQDWDMRA
jgi:DNA-binding winged helix-turn-helix (wHTH) protein/tetratricopeptide (TPR) repeat protein